MTFLLNCLLGLIVATYEQLDLCEEDFFKKRLCDKEIEPFVPNKIAQVELSNFHKSIIKAINKKSLINQLPETVVIEHEITIKQYQLAKNLELKQFIKNIRNGIAHQNLMATSQSKRWEGVRIWNHTKEGVKDFEVEFTIKQLKDFATFVGTKFVELTPNKDSH